jgi:ubiquitin-conjugating enzyme E2 S
MEGPADTPYVGKYFLLRFTFGPDFPTTPPTAHFLTKVYHPNVDISTGAICVNTLKRDWKASHTMKHCLAVIRCLLLEPFPESSLNEEAGKLFMESYQEYYKRTKLHADIHGRTTSVKPIITITNESSTTDESKCENSTSNTSTSNNNDETMRGILKHTSHNTSSMSVMDRNSGSTNSSNKPSSTTSKSNLMKKKSLKRL